MGIIYNKQVIKKDRLGIGSGPRDKQLKQQSNFVDSTVVDELKNHIISLQEQLSQKGNSTVSDDQINSEIIKAVKIETAKLIDKILRLEEENLNLKNTIHQLKTNAESDISNMIQNTNKRLEEVVLQMGQNMSQQSIQNNERPKMETVFVDPIDREAAMEKHITIQEDNSNQKEDMEDKVNKLKNLIGGKLPINKR